MIKLKFRNLNFIAIKILFLNDANADDIFVSKNISFTKKSYKYFLGYGNQYKIKSFSIILPETSVKGYDGSETKWTDFFLFFDGYEATDFYDKEVPKVGSNYTYLAVILIGLVHKKDDEHYHPRVLLKECK